MALAEAGAIVATLKSASDLLDRMRKTDDRNELRNHGSELADMLVTARMRSLEQLEAIAALKDELGAAKRELERLVDFDENAKKFERVKAGGAFLYRECDPHDGKEAAPYFCPRCYLKRELSILQGRAGYKTITCPSCKTEYNPTNQGPWGVA